MTLAVFLKKKLHQVAPEEVCIGYVKHWKRLPTLVVKSPSLEVIKICVAVIIKDMV